MELKKWAREIISRNRRKYFLWLIMATMDSVALFVQGLIIAYVFDAIEIDSYNKAILFVIATGLLMISRVVIFIVESYVSSCMKILIEQDVKESIFEQIYSVRRNTTKVSQGEFLNIITTDVKQLATYISEMWINLPANIIFTLIALCILLITDYKMTVVIFIPLILLTIICNMAGGKIEYISTLRRNAEAEFSEIVADVYHNVAVVKLSRSWQAISKNLEDSNTLLKKISIKGKLLSEFVSYLSEISYYISVLIILIASLYSADGFDLGKYTLFEYSLSLVNATFMAYSFAIIERGNTEASLKKIKSVGEFVNLKCSNSTKPLKIEKKELCGSVLRFVGYRHKLETNDLFQFEIKLGCINVMTGKVATGKTTLLKSMLGLTYHNGYVEFQGKRFRDLSEMEQLISVGYAPQKIHLFRMPLKDNIEMWRGSEANEYLKTIQEVELEEDFENFSVDAISNIGKGGALLSGGQKARVALARMLFANKDIYVVDDIFTEIDIQTFSRIWDNMLEKKNKGKTFIIVSNNEEIINRADHVITLQ